MVVISAHAAALQLKQRILKLDMLDVRDLPDDQIEFIQQLIEFMRQKHQKPFKQPEDETESIHLRSWSLA